MNSPKCDNCSQGMCLSDFKQGIYSNGWNCDNCQKHSRNFRWFCSGCSKDTCLKCFPLMDDKIRPPVCILERHSMVISSSVPYFSGRWKCDLCETESSQQRWFCEQCQIDFCFSCKPPFETKISSPLSLPSISNVPRYSRCPPMCWTSRHLMETSNFSGGSASNGWSCDECKLSFPPGTTRWCCFECFGNVCFTCHSPSVVPSPISTPPRSRSNSLSTLTPSLTPVSFPHSPPRHPSPSSLHPAPPSSPISSSSSSPISTSSSSSPSTSSNRCQSQRHLLTLSSYVPYITGTWRCDRCSTDSNRERWFCEICHSDVCLSCLPPPTPNHHPPPPPPNNNLSSSSSSDSINTSSSSSLIDSIHSLSLSHSPISHESSSSSSSFSSSSFSSSSSTSSSSSPFKPLHNRPYPICRTGKHKMVLSFASYSFANGRWICDLCQDAYDHQERWFCATCQSDYCFKCRPFEKESERSKENDETEHTNPSLSLSHSPSPSPPSELLLCPICLTHQCDQVAVPCGHTYCHQCLSSLTNNVCSLCRSPIQIKMKFYLNGH